MCPQFLQEPDCGSTGKSSRRGCVGVLFCRNRDKAADQSGCSKAYEKMYNIDMEKTQYSKTYDKIPAPDIAISMGCDVGCPYIGREFDDNWGLPDPTGCEDEVFLEVIAEIERNVLKLRERLI